MHLTTSPSCSKRDRFILSKLYTCIRDVNGYMSAYQFAAAASSLHAFFLYDVSGEVLIYK
jgi:valyl-tRNA synthetase